MNNMNTFWLSLWSGMATSIGLNPTMFALIMAIALDLIFTGFILSWIPEDRRKNLAFPIWFGILIGMTVLSFFDWFPLVIIAVIMLAFYTKQHGAETK